jgi:hypothetical protein
MGRTLELEAKGPGILKFGGKDYAVLFPFAILIELEAKLGRPMRELSHFLTMTRDEVPVVLEYGLKTANADYTTLAGEILSGMDAEEDIGRVIEFLSGCAFPKTLERFNEQLERLKEAGELLKNAPSVDAFSKMLRAIGLTSGPSAAATTDLVTASSSS